MPVTTGRRYEAATHDGQPEIHCQNMMKRICKLSVCLLLLNLPTFARCQTAVSRTGDDYTLSNRYVEAVFGAGKVFGIKKLVLNGRSVAPEGQNDRPWALVYKGPQGENPELLPEHAVYEGVGVRDDAGAKTLVFTWQLTLDYSPVKYPVRMYVTLPDGGELLQWNLEADLPAGWLVTDVKFPRIVIDRPAAGKVITTEGWGVEKPLDIATFEARYPSHASAMQFVLVHNGDGALYYGTEDRRGCGKTYSVQCMHKTVVFNDAIPASAGWIENGTFRLPWTSVVGFAPEGWEDAVVRWYRPFTFTTEWGSKPLSARNIPQWCYNADAWVRAKYVGDDTFDAVKSAAEYFGDGLGVHWYFWHNHPYDTHYPDYLPAKEGFAGMVRAVQQSGARVTPYINGRLWDPAADSYKRDRGYDASCRKPDGSLYTEIYPTSKVLNTVTCPSTAIWHRKIIGLGRQSPDRARRRRRLYRPDFGSGAGALLERAPRPPGRRREFLVRRLPQAHRRNPRQPFAGGENSDQRRERRVLHRPVRHAAGGQYTPRGERLRHQTRIPDGLLRPCCYQRIYLHARHGG